MAYGFEIRRADNSVLINSDDIGGLFVDVLSVGVNGTDSRSYGAFSGKTIVGSAEVGGDVNGKASITITYPSGVPNISVTNTGGASSDVTVIVE